MRSIFLLLMFGTVVDLTTVLPDCQCPDSYDWKSFGQVCDTHCMQPAGAPYCHPGSGDSNEPCQRFGCNGNEIRCKKPQGGSNWKHCAGYISAGDNIPLYQAVPMTPNQAEQLCAALPTCAGYTYQGSGAPDAITSVWLKEKWDCTPHSGWNAYKKPGYVSVTSGTCQRHGHQPLKTKEECREAALALGFKDDWGPHGGYADVVDGCSVRFTTDLFLNPAGTCKVGATTPRWIPLLNGKTECECSTYQPCLCQGEAVCDPTKNLVCSTSGDPHVKTFTGKRSHPMGEGEFVLAVCGSFRVHSCHKPINRPGISRNNGFVIDTQWGRVKITQGGYELPPNSGIEIGGAHGRRLLFPDGSRVIGNFRSLTVKFSGTCCGNTSGLCGAFNPGLKYADVFTDANGEYRKYPNSRWRGPFGGEYQSIFADSWRVTNPAERLFTEAECPTGPIESLPEDPPEAVDCPNKEELRAKAEEKCPRGRFYDDCVEDVLTTCDLDEWVDDATDAEDDFDEIDERDITVPEDGECPWNPDEAEQLACPGVDSLLGTECSIDCGKVVCAGKSDDEVKAMCATMRREFYARFGLSPDERSDENSDENSNENSDGDDS